jgi:hypothetical protein
MIKVDNRIVDTVDPKKKRNCPYSQKNDNLP